MIDYYLLTKPGIVMGNLFTLAAGFILGSSGAFDISLFISTLSGLACVMASACVFNNYIDRASDRKMERTKSRALASGTIPEKRALTFATLLGLTGAAVLFLQTNFLSLAIAAIGFFVYVVLYSLWKRKTVYGTAIGSIAGAVPPVVGYCAASGKFDTAAVLLFLMLVLWQMPHFYAIAFNHFDDYSKAEIPLLPMIKGAYRTKVHMAAYIALFIPTSMLLTYFGYTGRVFMYAALAFGIGWLYIGLKGFRTENDARWGKTMFRYSLVLIGALCLIIPFDKI